MAVSRYRLSDFDFDLPPGLIASRPAAFRSASRLLQVEPGGTLADRRFAELPSLLHDGDVLVMNDTRVIRSRLFGRKPSGGRVELMLERIVAPDRAWMQLRASHPPRTGDAVVLAGGARARVLERDGRFFLLRFEDCAGVEAHLAAHGEVPLPPYIDRPADSADDERYQTVYARAPGAVAAPTAGLHFDEALLDTLDRRGVRTAFITLHVGAGTFQPVEAQNIDEHRMHAERFSIPADTVAAIDAARERGGRVVAVGTTSLRTLEASATATGQVVPGEAETALFITPGYSFRVVDRLVTNFHLPRSTLLMLVSAFAGYGAIRAAYAHAIRERYRFYSYGDAMLLDRAAE